MQNKYAYNIIEGIAVTRFFERPSYSVVIEAMNEVAARGKFLLRLWVFEAGIDLNADQMAPIGQHGI